jgi:hypothetical protein
MSPDSVPASPELDFDPDALRSKYRHERDTRVRPDGNDQYVEVKGDFGRYVEDPYVEPGFSRDPLLDEVDALIIGGGFGGLMAGARLRGRGSNASASSRRAATLGAPGIGTATPARNATSRAISICRCSRRPAIFRGRSIRLPRKSERTRGGLRRLLIFMGWRAFRPKFMSCAGWKMSTSG